jgi:hypothetical protein
MLRVASSAAISPRLACWKTGTHQAHPPTTNTGLQTRAWLQRCTQVYAMQAHIPSPCTFHLAPPTHPQSHPNPIHAPLRLHARHVRLAQRLARHPLRQRGVLLRQRSQGGAAAGHVRGALRDAALQVGLGGLGGREVGPAGGCGCGRGCEGCGCKWVEGGGVFVLLCTPKLMANAAPPPSSNTASPPGSCR